MIFKKRKQNSNSSDKVNNPTGDGADLNTCIIARGKTPTRNAKSLGQTEL